MQPDTVIPFFAIAKEISLQFCNAYDPNEFAASLRALAEGEINVAPLITGQERSSRKRRRYILLAIVLTIAVILTVIHVMYFDLNWRSYLPPFIRDQMRRFYPGGR